MLRSIGKQSGSSSSVYSPVIRGVRPEEEKVGYGGKDLHATRSAQDAQGYELVTVRCARLSCGVKPSSYS